ncbi:MAG: tyrosine-protein phosphatase [Ktedonobacteraceae bacterium]|nr:tyrosine-protein phosphatase [Ktedonobacteraceae bacterium]
MEQPVNESELLQRRLALEGCYNVRDIGGYETLDGRTTRWRTLLRADSLNGLSLESQRLLLAYPVRTIIDLRRTAELRRVPAIFATSQAVRYVSISLLEDERKVREVQSLQMLYRLILETCQEPLKQILQLMATEDVFPCAVHCTVGKDRTGLITALLLSIANVPASTIANDYALSEQYLEPLFALLRARAAQDGHGHDGESREWLTQARPETMLATLSYLEQQYGSVKEYVQSIGMTREQLERLRSILVE